MRLLLALTLALLALPGEAEAQDTKRLADQLIRQIRGHQKADGGYGSYLDTCRVLNLLGRSPRRYTELDGPFFRRAAAVAAQHVPASRDEKAWMVLALASCITEPMAQRRDAIRDGLAADDGAWEDGLALLALRAVPPAEPRFPVPPADAGPAFRTLALEDPASVEPPPLEPLDEWMAWARAARVRGLRPQVAPELRFTPAPDAALPELLAQLELVVLVHGLGRRDQPLADPAPRPDRVTAPLPPRQALENALAFLEAHQDGGTFGLELPGWSGAEPGITALCLSASIYCYQALGVDRPDWIDEGLDALKEYQREDGAVMDYGVAVYTTSAAVGAFIDGGRAADVDAVARAKDFLVVMQADEAEGYDRGRDPHYGGVGYGGDERPDLSNTQMAIEAATRAGLSPDSEFYAKALEFLELNQNLGESSVKTWPRAGGGELVSGKDGGATYMPGNSPAGEDEVGDGVYTARSYGSMTYALTKSYLLCGLPLDDPRVDAALGWLVANFTVDENPGFRDPTKSRDGLYYYYLAMGRTLMLVPDDRLVRPDGSRLDWRQELTDHLLAEQRTDGSWFNEDAPRWYEGAPTLGTAYAVLALKAASVDADR